MRKNFITIGAFDGAHRGHKYLIGTLKNLAELNNMQSALMTFPLPPRAAISGQKTNYALTTAKEKFELLSSFGAGKIIKINFDKIKNLSPQRFFDILISKYNMGGILAGEDFAFGKDRQGHLAFLREACAKRAIIYAQADFLREKEHKISSSAIRNELKNGNIPAANNMLGYNYGAQGKVVKGRRLGRTIGFPTANLTIDAAKIMPRGVFAVKVILNKEIFKGVCNIGLRPTISENALPCVEVNIFDFDRDIYGNFLKIEFISKIRGEIKFKSIEHLAAQITKDVAAAKKLL
ncbi:MAG: riboflavin biosynthesis protein RibF [Elusimicrobiota bacterium]|jgi:riboflavin kinase/FMN adenylyltransferase|nr:riboflavin biosynthesis protein RibF [Elusimicrobiota bacterium]